MAYENRNAAYAYERSGSSAAPKLPQKQTREKQNKNKVVTMPQDAILRIRRRKHNPFNVILGSLVGAVVTLVVAFIIIGQVQLTELNLEISETRTKLSDQQSLSTQLNMAITSNLSTSEIENYAKNNLGMSKAENARKEYISLSGGDKAEISQDANLNFFQKVIRAIESLWS